MTKRKNIIQFDPFSDEHITPEIEAARRNAKPRRRVAPYHRRHKTVSASVDSELAEWLDDMAARREVTRSKLIAEILVDFRADFAE